MRRPVLGLIVVLGCGAPPREPTVQAAKTTTSAAASMASVTPAAPASLPMCAPDARREKPSTSLADRRTALEALAKGQSSEALASLEEALRKRPTDLAAFTFRAAVSAERNALREEITKRAERTRPEALPAIAPPHKTLARVETLPKLGAVTLKRLSEERHNSDLYAFLEQKKLPNVFQPPQAPDMLSLLPESLGELSMGAIRYFEGHNIVDYGPAVVMIADDGGATRSLSLLAPITEGFKAVLKPSAPPRPADAPAQAASPIQIDPTSINPHVRFSAVLGSLLVAELAHDGDGLAAKPDGFLVAYDLVTDKLAWVSDASVANAYSFHASGGRIVAAFSRTTEEERRVARASYTKAPAGDAKLVVIDASTGKTVATAPLAGRVDHVLGTKDRIFAWGDEGVETFEITAAAPSPKTELGGLVKLEAGVSAIPVGDVTRCWLTNAAIALDHRDGPALLEIARVLPEASSLSRGLQAAGEFFEDRAAGRAGLDLTEVEPVLVHPLPAPKVKSGGAKVAARRFVPVKETELFYPSPTQEPKKGVSRPLFAVNIYPNGPSHLYPPAFGLAELLWVVRRDRSVVLAYGSRFVVTLRDDAVQKTFDLAPFWLTDAPPLAGPRPVAFMTFLDDRLLVVNNPTSYDPASSTAFISSLDPDSGETVWRTEAGVLARQPIFFEDHVVTLLVRGKTSELVAFRRVDGQATTKVSFPEVAMDIAWDGRGAVVVTLPKEKKYFTFR